MAPIPIDKLVKELLEIKTLTVTQFWYACLLAIYELSDIIKRYGFLVEADVGPQAQYTYTLNLEDTTKCCVCPKFVSVCDLGALGRLTNLVNKPPISGRIRKEWQNKYAARNTPLPTDLPHSLAQGWDYVIFPKRKVDLVFSNTHPTETAHFVFYADYLEMDFDYGVYLIENVYVPMVERIRGIILPVR